MRNPYYLLTDRCKRLAEVTWSLICAGDYPNDVRIRFNSQLSLPGDPYAVFRPKDEDSKDLLVITGSDEVRSCRFLKVIGVNQFECVGPGDSLSFVHTKSSCMVCLDFYFRMAQELEMACKPGNEEEEFSYTVLHFANIESRLRLMKPKNNEGITSGSNMFILFLSVVLAILLILRWR